MSETCVVPAVPTTDVGAPGTAAEIVSDAPFITAVVSLAAEVFTEKRLAA